MSSDEKYAEGYESKLHTLIRQMRGNGFNEEEISAAIMIAKMPAVRQFVIDNMDIILDGTEEEVYAAAICRFGDGEGCELLPSAVDFVEKECSNFSIGGKCNMREALNAVAGQKEVDSTMVRAWLESINMEDLRTVVKALAIEDDNWAPLSSDRFFEHDPHVVAHTIQQFADETLVMYECGFSRFGNNPGTCSYEIKMLDDFGLDVPVPTVHDSLIYKKSDYENFPPWTEGSYATVENPGHVRRIKRLGVVKFATENEEVAAAMFDSPKVMGDWFFCEKLVDEPREEEDYPKKADLPQVERMPVQLQRVYEALKSDPGKAYYLHERNRNKYLGYLRNKQYIKNSKFSKMEAKKAAVASRQESPKSSRALDKKKGDHRPASSTQKVSWADRCPARGNKYGTSRDQDDDAPRRSSRLSREVEARLRAIFSQKMQPGPFADQYGLDPELLDILSDPGFLGNARRAITKVVLTKVSMNWTPLDEFYFAAKREISKRVRDGVDLDGLTQLVLTRVSSNVDYDDESSATMIRKRN